MLIFILLLLAIPVWSCPQGCVPVDKLTCACDATPLGGGKDATPSVQPLPDVAPADKMPSYERVGIKAEMPKSLMESDLDADRAKQMADSDGKKAAGL